MPVKSCQINGKPGHKWGDSGKCYTGPDSKKKAEQQGQAIHASENQMHEQHERIRLIDYLINEQSQPIRTTSSSNDLRSHLSEMQHNLEMMVQQFDYLVNSNPDAVKRFEDSHGHSGPIELVFSKLQSTITSIGNALNVMDDRSI